MKIDCREWGIETQYICSAGNFSWSNFFPLFHITYRLETKINPDLWIQRKTNTLFSVPNFLLVYLDIAQLTLIELSHFSPARNLVCCIRKCSHWTGCILSFLFFSIIGIDINLYENLGKVGEYRDVSFLISLMKERNFLSNKIVWIF